jgi:hypothetical protein
MCLLMTMLLPCDEIISSAFAPRYPIDARLPRAGPAVRDAERSVGLRVRAIV